MRFVPRDVSRARWAVGAAVLALAATGCTPESGSASEESPSASPATPTPAWTAVGGEAVTGPAATSDTAQAEVEERRVDAAPLPVSCAATGIEAHMAGVIGQLEEPEFTEVRTETRLECSWAGFDPDEGSEVVMVTFAPEKSLVAYPGHVPVKAVRDPAFFTTDAVSAMGGLAEWDGGEMFSGVKLHLPGILVSTTSNTPRVETRELLDAAAATAQELLAEGPQPDATPSASPGPEAADPTLQADQGTAGGGRPDGDGAEKG
ncbi:hypothetical protein FZ103_02810 [Streptomonospora sp. PA3]|uniref:hypothetical protein n=1 Tax=Streptomonospora sp. PA3 TaxID=2607326 RepID=UPI0012DBE74F|nr:hypothetical protein [Streptomonospora sp. PA3]MUL40117.1 hypothetical protein [Streptomonospora sp. PA3]